MPDTDIAHLTDRFMRRIHASLSARAHIFDTHKVGPIGGMLLLTLAECEPAKVQDLVAQVARDKSQVTRLVKTLETKGLIVRKGDVQDARVWRLTLTDLGRDTVRELQTAIAEALSDILSPLEADERETLRNLLRRL
ncbi:MAG: MarR family transcriptional regulator [Pseudomonadota bacterium]